MIAAAGTWNCCESLAIAFARFHLTCDQMVSHIYKTKLFDHENRHELRFNNLTCMFREPSVLFMRIVRHLKLSIVTGKLEASK